jgi:hypothetical protein
MSNQFEQDQPQFEQDKTMTATETEPIISNVKVSKITGAEMIVADDVVTEGEKKLLKRLKKL